MTLSKKKMACFGTGVLAVAVVAGTFAYWNQTAEILNPFDTREYGSTLVEHFKPEEGEDWQPGVEVNKDVMVENTGDTDLIVRVKLSETWTRKEGSAATDGTYRDSESETAGYDVYTTGQESAEDGLTASDQSVVIKTFTESANWIKGTDGWYYYAKNLAGGTYTDQWLDSVELLDDVDMGVMNTTYYVTAEETVDENTTWYAYTGKMPAYIDANGEACQAGDEGAQPVLHNKTEVAYVDADHMGYSDSDYVLTITIQTVQATQEAVNYMFGGSAETEFTAPAGCNWELK